MKTVKNTFAKISKSIKMEQFKALLTFALVMTASSMAMANPVFNILQSDMAATLVKWVCVPLGIVIFLEALFEAIKGQGGGFLGKVLSSVLLVGCGLYFNDLMTTFAGFTAQ